MNKKNVHNGSLDFDQLKKYASDLSKVYTSEKEKRKELKAANKQLVKYARALNTTIGELKDRNKELREAYLDTINRLVLAAEYKDKETGEHIVRMSGYCSLIAEKIGMTCGDVQNINYAAPMHDIGKIGVPDSILMKSGKLTADEFEIMKDHTTIGAEILANSNSEIIQVAQQIAVSHHERFDGRGYPEGLSGGKIPLVGMIVHIADVFDALTSNRPYKAPYPLEVAVDMIRKERGLSFSPDVVDVFLENIDEISTIKAEVDPSYNVDMFDFKLSERDIYESNNVI